MRMLRPLLPLALAGVLAVTVAGAAASLASLPGAAATASAQSAPVVRLQPEGVRVAAGGSGAVRVEVEAPAAGLGAWTVDITYDPAVVQPTDCAASVSGATALCNADLPSVPHTVRLTGSSASGATGSLTLGVVTFQATGGAGASSPLMVTVVTFTDPEGNPAPAEAAGGSITIE
jgi:hypothetical protein